MNKYQEAFNKIKFITNYDIRAFEDDDEEIVLIQQLIDERIEFESRKDKLVVGSKWVCVVECSTKMDMHYFNWKVGDRCKVLFLNNIEVTLMHTDRGWANKDNIRHFLHCFKPIEKGE